MMFMGGCEVKAQEPLYAQQSSPEPTTNSETEAEKEPLVEEQAEEIEITVTEELLTQPLYTPFRQEGTLRDSSRPAYIINREQIEAQGASTVQEALKFLPGILSDGTAGGQLGASSSQFIRGGNTAQTLILLDGRPINDVGFFGGFDLSEFTTDVVEQIEVVPGGGSTLYGSDAVGGVINIITRVVPKQQEIEAKPTVGLGSFGFNQQVVQTNGRTGDIGWFLSYNRTESENDFPFEIDRIDLEDERENADVLYNNLNLKLETNLGDRNRLIFNALYLTKDFGVAGGVPIPIDGSAGEFNNLTPEARQYTEEVLLDLSWQAKLGQADDSLLTSRIYADFLDYNFTNPDPNTFGTKDDIERTNLGLQVQHNWQLAANQSLTYGFDYRNINAENNTFSFATETNTENYDGNISQGAIFALYDIDLSPSFSFNLGLRQDFNSLENGSFTSPSLGVRLALGKSTTLRTNYAKSFRAPQIVNQEGLAAFNVVGNPDLQPERGNSFDIGVDQQLGDIGLLRLTFFVNTISDLINFEFGSPSTYTNIGKVRTTGIEAELNAQLANNLYAFANYTLNDPEILEDSNPGLESNELSFRGADSLNLGLAYETNRGLYVGLLLRHLSEFFTNNSNTESLPGYTTLDLKLRLPVSSNLVFNASWDNIFDQQYEEFPGFPGVGSSFRIGLSSEF
ncbi:MAG: TonB-dependent receptor [Symploca sp. SIO1C4]|uniref:TonB-dependent receptor n=1 Tax=Symploca sp. SIO1C4 TaxID=2607765 RepID=A0A6B3NA89_9CYAN|nr:TonB-dependent receptor [Symploca sp. SIO1C4]